LPETTLRVNLIKYTADPEETIAMAAKLCYSPAGIDEIKAGMAKKDQNAFIEKLVSMGHYSPIEHASFTFGVEGVSRALLAQLTRHRLASFSVQSQRYVSYKKEKGGFSYVVPPSIKALGRDAEEKFRSEMATMQGWYDEWVKRLGETGEKANQDARFVLPNACGTKIVFTMNARELLHFFSLRCCNRAQWEIRAMAWEMLRQCIEAAPAIFKNAGPGCINKPCPEGKMTCGQQKQVREKHRALMGSIQKGK